jgi:hypothetical protein
VSITLDTHRRCVAAFQGLLSNLPWRGASHVVPAI